MSHTTLLIIFAVLMLPGIAGVLFPVMPGIPYMFLVALIFGIVDKFRHLAWWELLLLLLVAALSLVVDYAAGMLGARYGGASRKSALAGLLGLVVGLIVFPPFGGIIGLFLGVLVAELLNRRERIEALRAATGSLLGSLAGIAANVVLALVFLGLFVLFGLR